MNRREIHEIEKRKRERRKRQQQLEKQKEEERQERMFKMMEQNPQFAMYANMQQNGMMPGGMPQMPMYNMPSPRVPNQQPQGGRRPPEPDQSGNPYAPRSADGGGRDRN